MADWRFLTDGQRAYLRDDHEPPTDNAEYQIRRKIREQTRQALSDLQLVADRVSAKDVHQIAWQRKKVSGEDDEGEAPFPSKHQPPGFALGIVPSVISLLYRLLPNPDVFEEYLEKGIKQALKEGGWVAHVHANVEIHDERHVDEIAETLEDEGVHAVPKRDLAALRDAGELSLVEHAELILEKGEELDDPDRRHPDAAREWSENDADPEPE